MMGMGRQPVGGTLDSSDDGDDVEAVRLSSGGPKGFDIASSRSSRMIHKLGLGHGKRIDPFPRAGIRNGRRKLGADVQRALKEPDVVKLLVGQGAEPAPSSTEEPRMLEPGEIAEIVIEPMPTSNLFKRGHRIRLDISSSNFPRFDVNPNTGEAEGKATRRRIAVNTVHLSPEHPSHVLLPVVPAER